MAVGLSPKFSSTIGLDDLSKEHFLVVALEAAKQLGWNIGYKSENGFVAYTKFSMSSYSEEVKLTIDNGLVTIKSECTGSQLVDWGKNKKNVENFIDTFNELKSTTPVDSLDSKYEEIKPELVLNEEDEFAKPAPSTMENLSGFLSIFKPVKGFFVTPLLIDLNVLLFILMIASGVNIFQPDNESLINWGANFRPVTLEGEWWRLLTNCLPAYWYYAPSVEHVCPSLYWPVVRTEVRNYPVYRCLYAYRHCGKHNKFMVARSDNQCWCFRCHLRNVWSLSCYAYYQSH
jgi:rhomboid protease GluP